MTYIKYLDLDRDFCICVADCETWWAADSMIKDLRERKPHGNGIYFLSGEEF